MAIQVICQGNNSITFDISKFVTSHMLSHQQQSGWSHLCLPSMPNSRIDQGANSLARARAGALARAGAGALARPHPQSWEGASRYDVCTGRGPPKAKGGCVNFEIGKEVIRLICTYDVHKFYGFFVCIQQLKHTRVIPVTRIMHS